MRNRNRNTDSNIKSGEVILTEEPFVYVLSSKDRGFRCDSCFEKGKVLKCSGCQFVHYCGRACQKDAWNDHKWECSNLKRVSPKVIPDAARMLARIINKLNRGDGNSFKSYNTATSFRMWKDLMSHYSDLKNDKKRMDHFTTLSVVLYEFMKDISLPNTVELMGIYGRMVINSFTILDTDMNSIGTGVYLASSVVDHSCDPNAVATFDGKTISIRATQDMPCLDWDQIRISYIDLMNTPYVRQKELLQNYYFLCQCDKCQDETQIQYVHAAQCLNSKCDNPINIQWKKDCQLYIKANKDNLNTSQDKELLNDKKQNGAEIQNGDKVQNGDEIQNDVDTNRQCGTLEKDDVIHCNACGTKYTDKQAEKFVKAMEFTELHLHNMKDANVAYADICKYCLDMQESVLHPLNIVRAQTLEHAIEALIQLQYWKPAVEYAEQLEEAFRYYHGDRNPLLGLLYLKHGKILLYEATSIEKALAQLKKAECILKITHGVKHPLYREQLMPCLRQALLESS